MSRRGFFITIEGGEKAGKTTQARTLAAWLREQGHSVVLTREPGGTPAGEAIRAILLNPGEGNLEPVTEALLFAASRSQLVSQVIRPALEAGQVVIADRYVDSSLAYQAYGLGLPWEQVLAVNQWAVGDLWPDLTVLLDCVDPTNFQFRPRDRVVDRIEQRLPDFHHRVAEGFRALSGKYPERYLVVDGCQPVEAVAARIRRAVTDRLPSQHTLERR